MTDTEGIPELELLARGASISVRELPKGEPELPRWEAVARAENFTVGGVGGSRRAALEDLAMRIAEMRLEEALADWGWTIVEEIIDQDTFLVVRDGSGTLRAIAVGDPSDEAFVRAIDADAGRYAWDMPVFVIPPRALVNDEVLRQAFSVEAGSAGH
jgi:hypothetical protein